MKKFLIAFFVLLVVGLAGIGGWLLASTHASNVSADQFNQWAAAQKQMPVEFVVTVPPETPVDQTLYISGDCVELGSWDAAGVPMRRGDDGKYHATVQLLSGIPHKFKITRGTWGTVERGAAGAQEDDHTFTAEAGEPVQTTVLTWVDGGKAIPGQVTLTGNIRVTKKFESQILG